MQEPLHVEHIDGAAALVDRFDAEVVPVINSSLDAVSRENLSIALDDLLPESGMVTAERLSAFADQVDLTTGQFADTLAAEAANLTGEARAQVEAQVETLRRAAGGPGSVTAAQIEEVLAQTPLTEQQMANVLAQTATARSQLDRLRAQDMQQTPQVPVSLAQVQNLLTRMLLIPERLSTWIVQFGLTPEQLANVRTYIDALPDAANGVLADLRAQVERFQPPLGVRFSRFAHMFGEWLATPLALLSRWAFFALLLLVVAKMLGGTGDLRQHVIAMLLAGAPLFLFSLAFVPNVAPALPSTFNLAFDYIGRVLALVGMAWTFLVLLKSVSVTHEFGMWRSLGVIALTWAILYVVFPVVSFMAITYILRG
jgi:hypothetical protein